MPFARIAIGAPDLPSSVSSSRPGPHAYTVTYTDPAKSPLAARPATLVSRRAGGDTRHNTVPAATEVGAISATFSPARATPAGAATNGS